MCGRFGWTRFRSNFNISNMSATMFSKAANKNQFMDTQSLLRIFAGSVERERDFLHGSQFERDSTETCHFLSTKKHDGVSSGLACCVFLNCFCPIYPEVLQGSLLTSIVYSFSLTFYRCFPTWCPIPNRQKTFFTRGPYQRNTWYCHVGNTAQHCRLGLFQDSDFAGNLEDSKSTSERVLCIFGSRTFVPIRWMCKKQTSASRSFTESEVISLDAGLRMDGIPALDLWDVVIEMLHSSKNTHQALRDHCRREKVDDQVPRMKSKAPTPTPNPEGTATEKLMNCLMWITLSQAQNLLKFEAQLYIFEDNETVNKMIIKGRSPTMRHVSRTHRVALDWLFDRTQTSKSNLLIPKKNNSLTC